ncbi:hypothetical protein B0H16DRAFT_1718385 [Mycena metata]|uniref:Uncharacterized protein n=1 Tax=Mycena metata TaxID=1033252 RepID=A0AAD7JFI5_9AGAR|nr:hypothetical protein B0H16DRAFT_1718385 [Mycena metata]
MSGTNVEGLQKGERHVNVEGLQKGEHYLTMHYDLACTYSLALEANYVLRPTTANARPINNDEEEMPELLPREEEDSRPYSGHCIRHTRALKAKL